MKHSLLRHAARVHRDPDVVVEGSLCAQEELAEIEDVLPVEFGGLIRAIRDREKDKDSVGNPREGHVVSGGLLTDSSS